MAGEYPRMIYSDDGRTHVLSSEDDERPEGNWSDEPTDAFYQLKTDHFTTVQPASADPHASLIDRLVERLKQEFPALTRNPPGRPPGSVNRSSEGE